MNKLLIIRGIPGSGKSTAAQEFVKAGVYDVFFEADQYFIKDGTYRFDGSKIGEAHEWCQQQVKNYYLLYNKNVIVSNTFTRFKEMKPYLNLTENVDIFECQNEFQNIHNVPEEILKNMKNRFDDKETFLHIYKEFYGEEFPGFYEEYKV